MNKHIVTLILILLLISSSMRAQNNTRTFTLDADVTKLLESISKNENDAVTHSILVEIINEKDTSVSEIIKSLIVKLQNHNLRLEDCFKIAKDNNSPNDNYLISAIDNSLSENIFVIKDRLNQFGITDAVIRKAGSKTISVEMLVSKDEEKIKTLLETTGNLTFQLVQEMEYTKKILSSIDDALMESIQGEGGKQFTKLIFFELSAGLNQFPINIKYKNDADDLLNREEVRKILPADILFAWSERTVKTMTDEYLYLYLLTKEPVLTGKVITEARHLLNPDNNNPVTSITMNSEGAAVFEKFTSENIGKECAMVFDGKVFSTPRIMSKITGGLINIEGISSLREAMLIPIILKSGPLSVPVKIISVN